LALNNYEREIAKRLHTEQKEANIDKIKAER
jgi:hypothetical protein